MIDDMLGGQRLIDELVREVEGDDTRARAIPREVFKFVKASHIIHAGDVVDTSVITELETVAPVMAVRGKHGLHYHKRKILHG